jgi:multidrug resistance efflux pump
VNQLRAGLSIGWLAAAAMLVCAAEAGAHRVRATGVIQAVRSYAIQVPKIEGQGGNLTIATLVENGITVKPGDVLATFDRSNEVKLLRDAETKLDDLQHQIEEKKAEHGSNGEKRVLDLAQAQADLEKAEIEMRKGPVLSAIDQEKNRVKLEDAREHVASLKKSNAAHDTAELADVRILELQRDRQKVAVERQTRNLDRLSVKAPIQGMVALAMTYRNNSIGHPEEGDQLWPGSPLLRIFDPSEMRVEVSVGEPDGAVLVPEARVKVHLDAFPSLEFPARFESASPVATSALGASVKTFTARFRLERADAHVLPDLSAAVDIEASR